MSKKVDGSNLTIDLVEDIARWMALAEEPMLAGSEYGEKISRLAETAKQLFIRHLDQERGAARVEVAVVGNFSAGKSLFINSLLGKPVCPVDVAPTTSSITRFIYGDTPRIVRLEKEEQREIEYSEYIEMVQHGKGLKKTNTHEYMYYYPFEGLRDISIIDTPGFENPKNEADAEVTRACALHADVVFFLLDLEKGGISKSVMEILDDLKSEQNRANWYFIGNKADLKTEQEAKEIIQEIKARNKKLFRDYFLYSSVFALRAQLDSMGNELSGIMKEIQDKACQEQPFHFDILGEASRGRYGVTVNDRKIALNGRNSTFWLGRSDILKHVDSIRLLKKDILSERLKVEFRNYYACKLSFISDIKNELEKDLSKHVGDKPEESVSASKRHFEMIQKLRENSNELVSKMISSGLEASVIARPIPDSRKSFLFTPYYEIVTNSFVFEETVKNSFEWKSLWKEITRITKAIEKDFGLNFEKEMNDAKVFPKKHVSEIFKIIDEHIMPDYNDESFAKFALINIKNNSYPMVSTAAVVNIKEFLDQLVSCLHVNDGISFANEFHQAEDLKRIKAMVEGLNHGGSHA